jgi:hypothetical protein
MLENASGLQLLSGIELGWVGYMRYRPKESGDVSKGTRRSRFRG